MNKKRITWHRCAGGLYITAAFVFTWFALYGEGTPPVRITVNQIMTDPTYDFSRSVIDIRDLANDAVHQVRHGWTLGLTRYTPVLAMTAPIEAVAHRDGTFSARPTSINIDLGYRDMTVAVPSELPGESCGAAQIIRHEEEHVATGRDIVRKYAVMLRTRIEATLKQSRAMRQPSADDAVALQKEMLGNTLTDVAEQMAEETSAKQQDIDSPEEYQRMLTVCNGELAELVANTRRQWIADQGF